VAGMLACEVASAVPESFEKMVLVGPYGLYDETDPIVNLSGISPANRPKMLVKNADAYQAVFMPPPDANEFERKEFSMLTHRSDEAVARLAGPRGDLQLGRRLHRIRTPTLLIWGEQDQLVPVSYARRFADGVRGYSRIEIVPSAGHLATIDAPDTVASLVLSFIDERV
jgi:pimeloyl-ACP methyl ester carboxylesterase